MIENDGELDAPRAAQVDQVIAEIEAKHGRIARTGLAACERARTGEARECALITGFPAFTAKRMIAKLLAAEPETKLFVLARDKFAADARQLLEELDGGRSRRGPGRRRLRHGSRARRAPSIARCRSS